MSCLVILVHIAWLEWIKLVRIGRNFQAALIKLWTKFDAKLKKKSKIVDREVHTSSIHAPCIWLQILKSSQSKKRTKFWKSCPQQLICLRARRKLSVDFMFLWIELFSLVVQFYQLSCMSFGFFGQKYGHKKVHPSNKTELQVKRARTKETWLIFNSFSDCDQFMI